jgi:hypothetical protein
MVESTQGIILLGKMWRHVTFGNVYWDFDCLQTYRTPDNSIRKRKLTITITITNFDY